MSLSLPTFTEKTNNVAISTNYRFSSSSSEASSSSSEAASSTESSKTQIEISSKPKNNDTEDIANLSEFTLHKLLESVQKL